MTRAPALSVSLPDRSLRHPLPGCGRSIQATGCLARPGYCYCVRRYSATVDYCVPVIMPDWRWPVVV